MADAESDFQLTDGQGHPRDKSAQAALTQSSRDNWEPSWGCILHTHTSTRNFVFLSISPVCPLPPLPLFLCRNILRNLRFELHFSSDNASHTLAHLLCPHPFICFIDSIISPRTTAQPGTYNFPASTSPVLRRRCAPPCPLPTSVSSPACFQHRCEF